MISPKFLFLVSVINLVSAVVGLPNKYDTFRCFNSKMVLVRKLFEAGMNYLRRAAILFVRRISKLWENAFGMHYLVKLAVAGAVS